MFASARRRAAHGTGEAPPLPARSASGQSTQSRACDLDLKDLARVSDHEIPDPLGKGGSAPGDDMVSAERFLNRSPLGVREADEHSVSTRMGCFGPSTFGH